MNQKGSANRERQQKEKWRLRNFAVKSHEFIEIYFDKLSTPESKIYECITCIIFL